MTWRTLCGPLLVLALASAAGAQDMANTPHNLSATGPGPVRAVSETEICIFCHGTHNTAPEAPLWNRRDPGRTYDTYSSSTLKVAPGQPSGASRLCLSCHDGTIAPGEVLSRREEISMVGGSGLIPSGRTNLGTDLTDDHPISFSYAESVAELGTELVAEPQVNMSSALDDAGRVQCTSCHDAHDNSYGRFLRTDPKGGRLCLACHAPAGWPQSSHANSQVLRGAGGADHWPSGEPGWAVADAACEACHVSHDAPGPQRLLTSAQEEKACLVCHSGNAGVHDVGAEMQKWSSHDVTRRTGIHDPVEVLDGRRTHVECVDCHNAHQAHDAPAAVDGVPGSLYGVSGVASNGAAVDVATREYEICFKCHADEGDYNGGRLIRQVDQPSIRARFDADNPSFHPVEAPGVNPDVPSLKSTLTPITQIRCTDCHSNDDGPGANGIGPRGPHGSQYPFLLERRYDTRDPGFESPQAYAMCYKCHQRESILGDRSFRLHSLHIEKNRTPCSVCHDPHGVDVSRGLQGSGTHLINFDTAVVAPNAKGLTEFQDTGRFRGSCSLYCHGKSHDNAAY